MSKSKTKLTPAQRGAQTKKRFALLDAYSDKFPGWSGFVTRDVERAMATSLKTGNDHPLLIEGREQVARNVAQHEAKLAAEWAQPFTAELEKHYTARIKTRHLLEGDCQRPWLNYFGYRANHLDEVEPLDATDLAYTGQWTPLALAKDLT